MSARAHSPPQCQHIRETSRVRTRRGSTATVAGLIDRLADRGLVSRGEDPKDRRATRVVPTDAARASVERLYSGTDVLVVAMAA
jgi:hypothetical protein